MSFFALLIALFALIFAGSMNIVLWKHLQLLRKKMVTLAAQNKSPTLDLSDIYERLNTLENTSQKVESTVEDIVSRIDLVAQAQLNQADEIKRLLRRACAPQHFGLEPRDPRPLRTPSPAYHKLIEGPKTPTPRRSPRPRPRFREGSNA